jgi:transposase InsO family protein
VDIHKNARLTPIRRAEMADRVLTGELTVSLAAREYRVCVKTARKWVERYRNEGRPESVADRSSRPRHSPRRIRPSLMAEIELLRRQRLSGLQISERVQASKATVHRVLARYGLNYLAAIDPPPAIQRYEHEKPGDLLHLDIKRMGRIGRVGHRINGDRKTGVRGIGWESVHVAIDDHSRIGFAQILPDQHQNSAVAFLFAAVQHYLGLGIRIRAILTDNGGCYRSKQFRTACDKLGLKHRFTKPYCPRTNGKAERFIQTLLREWAYAAAYQNSIDRAVALLPFLHRYNWHRPHASLDRKPPMSRIGLTGDNLLRLHS